MDAADPGERDVGALVNGALACAHHAATVSAWRRFERAAREPEAAQAAILARILRHNAGTAYGRRHGFRDITTVGQYQECVPVTHHEALAPWIDRVAAGEPGVLTRAPVRAMERSGGSTGPSKLVPYTTGLLAEFAAATGPWLHDLYARRPRLRRTRAYWAVSPVAERPAATAGGIPVGFDDDTAYFGPLRAWVIAQGLAVPREVARIRDMDRWRRTTIRHLVAADDLGLISVWSPTFLSLLMRELERSPEDVLRHLPPARAREVRRAVGSGGAVAGEDMWPSLSLISAWADGPSAAFVPGLRRWFPTVELQPKGLLATEGVVSFPLLDEPGAVAAVASHFLEFVDLERPEAATALAHELVAGRRYSPLLTTSGGLYRYHLKDVVRCVGHHEAAPLLRFEGRLDRVGDLCGEKVSEPQADAAIAAALADARVAAAFAMLAPVPGEPAHYVLFIEADAPDAALSAAAAGVDRALAASHPYAYCRRLGQLGPVRPVRVRDGAATYFCVAARDGRRLGAVKPSRLDTRTDWSDVFGEGGRR